MAWPVTVALLLENAAELIDVAMVGRLGGRAIAAVGYAAQLVHLASTLLQAVAMAGVALMARAVGARRPELAREALAGTLVVALIVTGTPVALTTFAPRMVLDLLHASDDVQTLAVPYLRWASLATLISCVPLCLESAQRARGNMRGPMLVAGSMVAVKIALNLPLMFGAFGWPGLGLTGAGVASVISQLVALAGYLALARLGEREGHGLLPRVPSLAGLATSVREGFSVALPAIGERLVMNLALLSYFAVLSRFGADAIAAYAIGVRVLSFTWLPSIGFGAAAATLVGQALGAGDVAAARRAAWRATVLALALTVFLGVLSAFSRESLARVFTHEPAILADLMPFLLMLAIAQPFLGVHFTLSGALRGAGDTLTPLVGATVGNWGFRVPVAWLFTRQLGYPIEWAWAALVGDHVLRATWYFFAVRGAGWTQKKLGRDRLRAPDASAASGS